MEKMRSTFQRTNLSFQNWCQLELRLHHHDLWLK